MLPSCGLIIYGTSAAWPVRQTQRLMDILPAGSAFSRKWTRQTMSCSSWMMTFGFAKR